MKKIFVLIAVFMTFSAAALATDNGDLDLPVKFEGKKARLIYEKLDARSDVSRQTFGDKQDPNSWTTHIREHYDINIRCAKVTTIKKNIAQHEYTCHWRMESEAALELVGLE